MYAPDWFWSIFLLTFISQSRFFIIWEICIILLSAFVFPCFCTVLIRNCPGALRQCGSNFFPVIILLTFKINTIYHNQLYQYIPAECLCSCSPTREHSILHWRTSLSSSSKAKKRRFLKTFSSGRIFPHPINITYAYTYCSKKTNIGTILSARSCDRSKRRHHRKAKIPLSTWPAKTISNTGLWPPLIYIKHKKIDIYNREKPKYL